ncbi:hypothetical protein CENDO_03530 [Corynebacterium endometrii]|uniref:Uncharacterized protein n=1 Tax=Corynebacterium endometrii TaxID=2488819 RepID=A0A4P7QF41_9CORY|nr:hypothetical protein CENDO_03530 [Corynebacterium endometrii]
MPLGKNADLTAALISTVVSSGVISGPEAFTANASDLTTHATAKVMNESFTKVYSKEATNNGMVFSVETELSLNITMVLSPSPMKMAAK